MAYLISYCHITKKEGREVIHKCEYIKFNAQHTQPLLFGNMFFVMQKHNGDQLKEFSPMVSLSRFLFD